VPTSSTASGFDAVSSKRIPSSRSGPFGRTSDGRPWAFGASCRDCASKRQREAMVAFLRCGFHHLRGLAVIAGWATIDWQRQAVQRLKEATMLNRQLILTLVVVSASFVPAASAMAAMNHNETLLLDA
jgi:hypothetical protein